MKYKKEKFEESDVGRFVVYNNTREELGKIKSISDETHAFIVYNCNKEWDRIDDYTAARTNIADIEFIEDDKDGY